MLGLTFDKVLILACIAMVLLGPERLPYYAEQLARMVKKGKGLLSAAQVRARDELGPEFDQIDWKRLDPRQYDPRQIIRQALLDDPPTAAGPTGAAPAIKTPADGDALQTADASAIALPQPPRSQGLSSGDPG